MHNSKSNSINLIINSKLSPNCLSQIWNRLQAAMIDVAEILHSTISRRVMIHLLWCSNTITAIASSGAVSGPNLTYCWRWFSEIFPMRRLRLKKWCQNGLIIKLIPSKNQLCERKSNFSELKALSWKDGWTSTIDSARGS